MNGLKATHLPRQLRDSSPCHEKSIYIYCGLDAKVPLVPFSLRRIHRQIFDEQTVTAPLSNLCVALFPLHCQ